MTLRPSYKKSQTQRYIQLGLLLMISIILLSFACFNKQNSVGAVTKSSWIAGDIISDINFTDNHSMSVAEIQGFLNSKIGTCDINGSAKATEYGSKLTRSQYARSRGWAGPPYVCLNKYYEVPKKAPGGVMPANNWNKNLAIPNGARSAAWIIKDAADRYRISPKVLLVKIATESSGPLTSDTWPLFSQYRYAMGSHCPDSGPGGSASCDSDYAGFSIQIYSAAQLMRWYIDSMEEPWWSYKKPGNNYVLWNVVQERYKSGSSWKSCGGSTINIKNKATAALYTYTPYQPNQAALDNMYTAVPYSSTSFNSRCAAYGNRNFWRTYWDWFGSSRAETHISNISFKNQPFTDSPNTVEFTIKNSTNKTISFQKLIVASRDPNNLNLDYPAADNVSLSPGQSYTYRKTRTLSGGEGNYKFFIAYYNGKSWNYPTFGDYRQLLGGNITKQLTKKPTVTDSLKLSSSSSTSLYMDKTINASYTIRNNSSLPVNIGRTNVIVRDKNNNNFDFPLSYNIEIQPNSSYVYKASQTLPKEGEYTFRVGNYRNDWGWSDDFPSAANPSVSKSIEVGILPSVLITQGLKVNMPKPVYGNQANATFSIKNHGESTAHVGYLAAISRDLRGTNYDFPLSPYITIGPGQTYNYSANRTLPKADLYKIEIGNYRDSVGWSKAWPSSNNTSTTRELIYNLDSDVRLSSELNITINGTRVTGIFEIKNYSSNYREAGKYLIAARNTSGTNYDLSGPSHTIGLGSNSSYSHTRSRSLPPGKYSIWIAHYSNEKDRWDVLYPKSQVSTMLRTKTITIH